MLDKKVLFVVLLVIVAVVLFFQPFEELFGYGDGYIEFNIGGMIARNGSVRFNDPLVASLPADVMSYFTFKDGQLFNSLMIVDYSTGEVAPSFLHLYATWLAIFQQSVGVGGASLRNPCFKSHILSHNLRPDERTIRLANRRTCVKHPSPIIPSNMVFEVAQR